MHSLVKRFGAPVVWPTARMPISFAGRCRAILSQNMVLLLCVLLRLWLSWQRARQGAVRFLFVHRGFAKAPGAAEASGKVIRAGFG